MQKLPITLAVVFIFSVACAETVEEKKLDNNELEMKIRGLEDITQKNMRKLSKYPRRKYITGGSKNYITATYASGVVSRIEETGNKFLAKYPKAIRGEVIANFSIRANGELEHIKIIEVTPVDRKTEFSDIVKRILRLAQPFDKFSDDMKKQFDILHIIRTFNINNLRNRK